MMKFFWFAIASVVSCSTYLAAQMPDTIGGEKIVTISRKAVSATKPEFTSVTVLPGRGMELLYITANFPGKGEVAVLKTPDLATAAKQLDVQDNEYGNAGYMIGAAFLAPYANRIGGPVSADGKTVSVTWRDRTVTLPANSPARPPDSPAHAMHGLILKSKATDVKVSEISGGSKVTGTIHAGDFGNHWFSSTDFTISIALTADAIDATVVAKNVGEKAEPMAIAWHPYLNLPSGDRGQAKLYVPATTIAEMSPSRMPTGKWVPVTGSRFDFNHPGGTVLDKDFYDGNLSGLERKDGVLTVRLVDPAAHYGIDVIGYSPEMKTIQMASMAGQSYVAIEHQYNYLDPFGKEWGSTETGMVTLEPGHSTNWHVRLHVFVPE
jgi:galactose mutarotase-like enzyme